MSTKNVPTGISIPEDFFSIIEIPQDVDPIKYEMNKTYDTIVVDRFLSTAMFYPANYGYIPQTLSEDGDPLDVLVISPYPVVVGSVIRSRPVGVMYMEDENGIDAKIIAVPHQKLSKQYDNIQNITDLEHTTLNRIQHFFEHYKDLEEAKWVKFNGWGDIDSAQTEILKCVQFYKDSNPHT